MDHRPGREEEDGHCSVYEIDGGRGHLIMIKGNGQLVSLELGQVEWGWKAIWKGVWLRSWALEHGSPE